MSWRVARSLDQLLAQIDARFPGRNRVSDGSIGDAAHASRVSDHNPWYVLNGQPLVTARDYTHDPGVGLDMHVLSDQLQSSRDSRIKYVIFDGWIMDARPQFNPWRWVRYVGANMHRVHLHLSVMPNPSCDNPAAWSLPMLGGAPEPPPPAPGGSLPAVAVGSRVIALTDPYTSGTDVLALQRVLNRWYPSLPRLDEDGIYGPVTMARVKLLQSRAGILADGIAGRQTFGVLHMV